jgi:RNA polymerase sigma-70 factor (ECF subfamily)
MTEDRPLAASHPQWFATTHWSVVLAARQGSPVDAAAALENLCRLYWYPLYAFLRREGRSPHDAQDLTQEFFARLLQGKFLENVAPHKGRLRSFLLASLKHFLSDEWDKARTLKRGGGQSLIPLDNLQPEDLYRLEPDTSAPAERLFERRWAVTLLAQALARLREETVAAGKTLEFDQLKVFLSAPTGDGAYDRIAAQLGLATETVAVKVYRLRKRYGELIRTEVAHTLADPADVEEELRHLFDAIGR